MTEPTCPRCGQPIFGRALKLWTCLHGDALPAAHELCGICYDAVSLKTKLKDNAEAEEMERLERRERAGEGEHG